MKNNKKIFCTLGPSSINKKFLTESKKYVDLLRLNMSHIKIQELQRNIKFIKKYTDIPICIDTEGAQIRTKVIKKKYIKKNEVFKLHKSNGYFNLYPEYIFKNLKKNDLLDIGFENLKIKITNKSENFCSCKCTSSGFLENNKGVHLTNRKIKIEPLTNKDTKAIEIGLINKINYYALSFTNSVSDIDLFEKYLPYNNKINKIETKNAIKNLDKLLRKGTNFLIDRGDLSKEIGILNIPYAQRKVHLLQKKLKNKNVFVATNFLESMVLNPYPTKAELNDIYSSLELGANGLVLAAETAIGKYPLESIKILKGIINKYQYHN